MFGKVRFMFGLSEEQCIEKLKSVFPDDAGPEQTSIDGLPNFVENETTVTPVTPRP